MCVFCKHAEDARRDTASTDSLVLAAGTHAYIVLNRYPYNNGHLMVVPYRHTSTLTELSAAELHEMIAFTQRSEQASPRGVSARGDQRRHQSRKGCRRRHRRAPAHSPGAAVARRHQLHDGGGGDARAAGGFAVHGAPVAAGLGRALTGSPVSSLRLAAGPAGFAAWSRHPPDSPARARLPRATAGTAPSCSVQRAPRGRCCVPNRTTRSDRQGSADTPTAPSRPGRCRSGFRGSDHLGWMERRASTSRCARGLACPAAGMARRSTPRDRRRGRPPNRRLAGQPTVPRSFVFTNVSTLAHGKLSNTPTTWSSFSSSALTPLLRLANS